MSVNHNRLYEAIADEISSQGGWLSFEQYMQMALYMPQLGYYESADVFGKQGDYVTAVGMGPWLGLGFADAIHWAWQQLGEPKHWCLLEQGGGSGRLLAQVMQALRQDIRHGLSLPDKLIAIERSSHMRQRQQQCYQQHDISVLQFDSLQAIDDHILLSDDGTPLPVVVFSNELPDAFPVCCFTKQRGQLFERGVIQSKACAGGFDWQCAATSLEADSMPNIRQDLQDTWPEGYISEWNPASPSWQASLAAKLQQTIVLTVDYGYTQSEYYRGNRQEGTLMGHHEHQVIHDVLSITPGSLDMTAHIDFTTLAATGLRYGLEPCAYLTQGAWLAQSPAVIQRIQAHANAPSPESVAEMAFAKQLLMPFGMGESFKLLIQSKGLSQALAAPEYLASFDRLSRLGLNMIPEEKQEL